MYTRHFLIIFFMLAGLSGHCLAAEEQPADGGDSTAQPAEPAPENAAVKKPDEKKKGDRKTSGSGEEEPDCD